MYKWKIKKDFAAEPDMEASFEVHDYKKELRMLTVLLDDSDAASEILERYRLSDFKKFKRKDFLAMSDVSKKNALKLYNMFKFHEYIAPIRKTPYDYPEVNTLGEYLYRNLSKENKEYFVTALFDIEGKLLGINTHFIGDVATVASDPNIVFQDIYNDPEFKTAASFIIAHNHVVGIPLPSREDIEVTKRFVNAGENLLLPLTDHIVVSPDIWGSIRKLKPEIWEEK